MSNLSMNAITSEIDPFAVFGADDDDDEGSEMILVHPNDEPLTKKTTTLAATTTTMTNTTLPVGEKLSKIPKLYAGTDVLPLDLRPDNHTMTDDEHHYPDSTSTTTGSTCIIPWPEQRNNLTILLYVSSQIRLVQSLIQFGGSRGYIATETISSGTLVLIEQPIVSWSDDSYSNTNNNNDENEKLLHILYHHILMNPSLSANHKQEIIHDLEYFHPTKGVVDECLKQQQQQQNDCESDQSNNNRTDEGQEIHSSTKLSTDTVEQVYNMIQELHLQYGEDSHRDSKENNHSYDPTMNPSMPNYSSTGTKLFQQIRNDLIHQQHFTNSDETPMNDFDIYRILLALRYNALQSGLYYYSAMFNHSDLYNCVKFIPNPKTSTTRPTNNPNNSSSPSNLRYYSEIRTTRTVYKGEPLTISYIPNILSHASRRHYLWQQHRFDIGNSILNEECILRKMEYIHNEFPILSNMNDYKETATYNIETAMTELEAMYHDIEHLLQQQQNQGKVNDDTDLLKQAQELEQASLELCISAEQELLQNPIHILLIPCRRLHVDICCMMQQHYDNQSLLSFVDRMKLLSRLVLSAYQLRQLQIMLYGPDHFDIARTNLDLVHGIEELLSRSPKHLLNLSKQISNLNHTTLGSMQLHTITHWSTLEYTLRKDYERIKALYPNNANDYINRKFT